MYQKKMGRAWTKVGGGVAWQNAAAMGDTAAVPIACPAGQSPVNLNVTGLAQDQWICSQTPGSSSAPGTVNLPIIGQVPTTYALIGGGLAAFLLLRKG